MILDAAIRVFAQRGFHDTRVSDIAREAGISHGLVYHYFKSKDDVLICIFRDRWALFVGMAQALCDEAGPAPQKLGAIVRFLLDSYQVNPALMKVLLQELVGSPHFFSRGNIEALDEALAVVEQIIQDGMQAGEIRTGLDARIAAQLFYGGVQQILAVWAWKQLAPDELGDLEELKRTVTDLLLGGLLPRSHRSIGA